MEVDLSVRGVYKSFKRGKVENSVLKNISFDILKGELVSIFGPNGCGKSTLMNVVAGIIPPDKGEVYFGREEQKRLVGIVFQDYEKSLMPWRTCLENIVLPLEANSDLPRLERKEYAISLLKELGLSLPISNYPHEMSGGQKQLTCIARAMILQPSFLLLDEPFSSLDYQTRIDMQSRVQRIWEKRGVTIILISHELDEAIYLADRLILLTQPPTEIAESFEVQLKRPRSVDALSSVQFTEVRARVLSRITGESETQ